MCDRSLIVRICIIITIITLSMMRKTELSTFTYRLTVEPLCGELLSVPTVCPVLRGVLKAEVDLNTVLYGWDCRQCPD